MAKNDNKPKATVAAAPAAAPATEAAEGATADTAGALTQDGAVQDPPGAGTAPEAAAPAAARDGDASGTGEGEGEGDGDANGEGAQSQPPAPPPAAIAMAIPERITVRNNGPIDVSEPLSGKFIPPGGAVVIEFADADHGRAVIDNLLDIRERSGLGERLVIEGLPD